MCQIGFLNDSLLYFCSPIPNTFIVGFHTINNLGSKISTQLKL